MSIEFAWGPDSVERGPASARATARAIGARDGPGLRPWTALHTSPSRYVAAHRRAPRASRRPRRFCFAVRNSAANLDLGGMVVTRAADFLEAQADLPAAAAVGMWATRLRLVQGGEVANSSATSQRRHVHSATLYRAGATARAIGARDGPGLRLWYVAAHRRAPHTVFAGFGSLSGRARRWRVEQGRHNTRTTSQALRGQRLRRGTCGTAPPGG